jgi:hypothetical protein
MLFETFETSGRIDGIFVSSFYFKKLKISELDVIKAPMIKC